MEHANVIKKELERVVPILESLGFLIDTQQLHVGGERAVLSQEKLVLIGTDKDNRRIVIKCSRYKDGIKEIKHEKKIRDSLINVSYTNDSIAFPDEIYFNNKEGYSIFVTEYIAQDKVFVEHEIKDQFFMIIRALERQEAFHATTHEHVRNVRKTLKLMTEDEYSSSIQDFYSSIKTYKNSDVQHHIKDGLSFFEKNKEVINTYAGHLIHEDFVPHNFRIKGNQIYKLDYSSLQYGNKYESWARLLNYMVIHNPELEKLLNEHIQNERGEREYLSLKVMRVYKLFQLLNFYMSLLDRVDGNLLKLTKIRIEFWAKVMGNVVSDKYLSKGNLKDYKKKRDSLRSQEEKDRQREFAIAE